MRLQQIDNSAQKPCEACDGENADEACLARAAQVSDRIRKGLILTVLGCAAFAVYHFRTEIKDAHDKAFPRSVASHSTTSDSAPANIVQASAKTKEVVRAIKVDSEKRNAEVESFFK